MENYLIRQETPSDYRAVEELTRRAFWNVYRPGCLEHYVLHLFRSRPDFIRELDLVMELCGKIIGHVMFAEGEITLSDGNKLPVMTFGPLSIDPEYQKKGYGSILLSYAMEQAKTLGAGALAIEGDFGFYGKLGFVKGKELGIFYKNDPDADYFLVKELKEGFFKGVSGTYDDPSGYFVDEEEAKKFDEGFPPID